MFCVIGVLGAEVLNCVVNAEVGTEGKLLVGISGELGSDEVVNVGTAGRSPTAAVHIHFP